MPQGSGSKCSRGTCVARSGGSQPGVTPRPALLLGILDQQFQVVVLAEYTDK